MFIENGQWSYTPVSSSRTYTAEQIYNNWFNYYYAKYFSISTNIFEWVNLPETLDSEYIEFVLNRYGSGFLFPIFSKGENKTFTFQPVNFTGERGLNGRPLTVTPYLPNNVNPWGNKNVINDIINIKYDEKTIPDDLKKYFSRSNNEEGVLCGNTKNYISTFFWLSQYASEMANNKMSASTNRENQQMPWVVFVRDSKSLSYKNFIAAVKRGERIIPVYNNSNTDEKITDDVVTFNADAPYLLDKLNTDLNNIQRQIVEDLGLDVVPYTKKERMSIAEIESNKEVVSAILKGKLKSRQSFCDLVNKHYGTNMEVVCNFGSINEIKKDGEILL